jgi:class 3 adenylate cyclase
MAAEVRQEIQLEIAHVLFIDIVGYSKLSIDEQAEYLEQLREIVRATEAFQVTQAQGKLMRLPTGDGAALAFRTSSEAPVQCAMEIAGALRKNAKFGVRMGIHSGAIKEVTDLSEQGNIAGAGSTLRNVSWTALMRAIFCYPKSLPTTCSSTRNGGRSCTISVLAR